MAYPIKERFMARHTFIFATILTVGLLVESASGQQIRVRLLNDLAPRQVALAAVDGDVRLFAGEFADPLMTMTSGELAVVSRASNQLHVKIGEMKLYAKSLRVEPINGATIGVTVREGRRLDDQRVYPGELFIAPDGEGWELALVNEIDLEEYVACVVASEYGLDDLEGSKAMAVIARTYALSALDAETRGYHLDDHTLAQVFRGMDGVTDLALRAARETAGEVATYRGGLIEAVYFSSSGGRTANNEDVWEATPLPYLRGKDDPYDGSSPHAQWTAQLPRADLIRGLEEAFDVRVDGFVIGERSRDGRVASIELALDNGDRREISANAFRLAVVDRFGARTLRSTLFDVRRDGDTYVFEGRGYGHGVGLSQWGAHEMARRGSSYRDILTFYYSDIDVQAYDRVEPVAEPEPSVATRPDPVPARSQPTQRIGW